MRIRAAAVDDAPAMGRVMVEAWLSAHRGQMPDTLWHKRVEEWTPEVSAAAWARLLAERQPGPTGPGRTVPRPARARRDPSRARRARRPRRMGHQREDPAHPAGPDAINDIVTRTVGT